MNPRNRHQDSAAAADALTSLAASLDDSFGAEPLLSLDLSDESDLLVDVGFLALRLSLTYQPEPLNTIPTGCGTRRIGPSHSGHTVSASSENF